MTFESGAILGIAPLTGVDASLYTVSVVLGTNDTINWSSNSVMIVYDGSNDVAEIEYFTTNGIPWASTYTVINGIINSTIAILTTLPQYIPYVQLKTLGITSYTLPF